MPKPCRNGVETMRDKTGHCRCVACNLDRRKGDAARRIRNKDADIISRRRQYKNNRDKFIERARQRKMDITQRSVPWADKAAIRATYAEAKRLTIETGIEHHVDHVIPLNGENVCGLHVETNLQIMYADRNRRKYNRWDA